MSDHTPKRDLLDQLYKEHSDRQAADLAPEEAQALARLERLRAQIREALPAPEVPEAIQRAILEEARRAMPTHTGAKGPPQTAWWQRMGSYTPQIALAAAVLLTAGFLYRLAPSPTASENASLPGPPATSPAAVAEVTLPRVPVDQETRQKWDAQMRAEAESAEAPQGGAGLASGSASAPEEGAAPAKLGSGGLGAIAKAGDPPTGEGRHAADEAYNEAGMPVASSAGRRRSASAPREESKAMPMVDAFAQDSVDKRVAREVDALEEIAPAPRARQATAPPPAPAPVAAAAPRAASESEAPAAPPSPGYASNPASEAMPLAKAKRSDAPASPSAESQAPSKKENTRASRPEADTTGEASRLQPIEEAAGLGQHRRVIELADALLATRAAGSATHARALELRARALEGLGRVQEADQTWARLQAAHPTYRPESVRAARQALRESRPDAGKSAPASTP